MLRLLIGAILLVTLLQYGAQADDEASFRSSIEARKDRLLGQAFASGAALMSREQLARAKRNIRDTDWGAKWFASRKEIADYLAAQPDSYIDSLVPDETPTSSYGFTCPNCVGAKSQEGTGASLIEWDYHHPDVIKCKSCGQVYPSAKYPEEGRLRCPRTGREFTYYVNQAEREHPEDRSGKYAWHWVGRPIHLSFEGIIRQQKAGFAVSSVSALAQCYAITDDKRYARMAIRLLDRLATCYRNWSYHDYFGTVADCDPIYAAWHIGDMPDTLKCNPCWSDDQQGKSSLKPLLMDYWGGGRLAPSTDAINALAGVCTAYEALRDEMTAQQRTHIARDLMLEWIIGAEPFLGGEGKAENHNNKSPRVYLAMAAVGKCLGIPQFVDTALRGYEGISGKSFDYDGMSRESPAYTSMYLGPLVDLTEMLQGYRWPESFDKRHGTVDLYGTDSRLKLMLRSMADQTDGSGNLLPLSDTSVNSRPDRGIMEIGAKRYPEYFAGRCAAIPAEQPTPYAVFNLDAADIEGRKAQSLPEIYFPAWMTAILRNGDGADASVLAFAFSPPGGHRHADNLDIYYADRGDVVLEELGYVGDMPIKSWAGGTLGHNLVIVDDSEQGAGGEKKRVPKFHFMATSPHLSVVEASSTAYAQCSDYRRLVALVKGPDGQTFAIDIFRVAGGKKHAYQVLSGIASSDAKGTSIAFDGLSMPSEPPLPKVGNSIKHEDIYGLRDVRTNSTPPPSWQATWKQKGRAYLLWMLTQLDRVEASNGPGQTLRTNGGRRERYLNAIREGDSLRSTFVAVHEPSGTREMPIKRIVRLDVPKEAGPDAVALRIESDWGTYHVFSEFANEATVDGIAFQGQFGAICAPPRGKSWLMAVGATTLKQGDHGFSGKTARWTGEITKVSDDGIATATAKPADWPSMPDGCQSYLAVDTGTFTTGFPAVGAEQNTILTDRFPFPTGSRSFDWPALRIEEK